MFLYLEVVEMFNPEFLATENNDPNDENDLIQYLQKQSPEVLQRVAKSASEDIQEIIRHNVQGLLGMLPSDQFDVKITSSKDNIANLLSSPMALDLIEEGEQIKEILKEQITQDNQISEYKLANLVPKLWPAENPIMLSASSPIRDWLTFSENGTLTRNCFSFRGASGIDGTLSLALGISRIKNPLLLVTGDLAFIHDINGWLIENSIDMNLTILLINNNGGNIFNRIYKENLKEDELKKLFLMPKEINWSKLAEGYQVNFKSVANFKKLREAFDWSISIKKSVIIKVDIDPESEICEKNSLLEKIIGS